MLGLTSIELLILGILFFIFFVVSCVVSFVLISRARWKYNVVVMECTKGNKPVITIRDKARLVSIGDGGEEVFYLKRQKKYKAGVGKRIGNNQIAWMIGEDGYWYNIDFSDFNKSLLEVGLRPLDRNVRLSTSAMRKSIEKEFASKNFMDKYGTLIYGGMFFLIILAFGGIMWFAFDKLQEISSSNAQAMETAKEVMELAKQTLSSIDNIKSGGSGLVASGNG